jgi:hypothetical protein
VGSWAELFRDDRLRFEIELGKHGITLRDLLAAGVHDPVLGPQIERLSCEAKGPRVVEWFCDEGHSQPAQPVGKPGHVQASMHRWEQVPPLPEDADDEPAPKRSGAKSRWRRADLETIFVKQPNTSARELAGSGDLIEPIRHQRISELRARGDVGVDASGRLALPPGTTGEGGWVILPQRD